MGSRPAGPPVVDAHQHFWDPDRIAYSWMTDEIAAVRRRYGPDDLEPILARLRIERTILVQADSTMAETEDLLRTADMTVFVAGVVGWVDLTLGTVDEAIRALQAGSGGRKLVGFRHDVRGEPDPEWLLRPDVRRGFRAIGGAGLSFDLLIGSRELPAALTICGALPHVRFVVDHLADPPIRDGTLEPWASLIRPLGDLPNVWCKVSGLVTRTGGAGWGIADLKPYVRHARRVFGTGRLVFGSDWPICLLAASYEQVYEAARVTIGESTDPEIAAIFGGNAVDAYALDTLA